MKVQDVIDKLEKEIKQLKGQQLTDNIYIYKLTMEGGRINTYIGWD